MAPDSNPAQKDTAWDNFESAPIAADPGVIAKYQLLSTLGKGGMGVVFKARERSTGRLVAIKTLSPDADSDSANLRFQTEAKLLSKLRHPNIVTLLEFGITETSIPYLVLDFIEGRTLAELISEEGQLPAERIIDSVLQVCDALTHAHAMNILHRDIKPSNMIFAAAADGKERTFLMDFGVGKALAQADVSLQRLTRTGVLIGTPTYMSPEQSQGRSIDARSDLYSIGCVMYEALAGTPPFISRSTLGTVIQHQRETPLPIAEASMGRRVAPQLEAIVFKLLEKDPQARFQTATELRKALQPLSASDRREWLSTTWVSYNRIFQTATELRKALQPLSAPDKREWPSTARVSHKREDSSQPVGILRRIEPILTPCLVFIMLSAAIIMTSKDYRDEVAALMRGDLLAAWTAREQLTNLGSSRTSSGPAPDGPAAVDQAKEPAGAGLQGSKSQSPVSPADALREVPAGKSQSKVSAADALANLPAGQSQSVSADKAHAEVPEITQDALAAIASADHGTGGKASIAGQGEPSRSKPDIGKNARPQAWTSSLDRLAIARISSLVPETLSSTLKIQSPSPEDLALSAEGSEGVRRKILNSIKSHSRKISIFEDDFVVTDKDLVGLRGDSYLRDLYISGRGITDKGLEELTGLQITSLTLTDTSAKDMHALKGLPLKQLKIGQGHIGAEALTVASDIPSLRFLHLSGVYLDSATGIYLPRLYSASHLKVVDLVSSHVNKDEVLALRKRLPMTIILRSPKSPEGSGVEPGTFAGLVAEGNRILSKTNNIRLALDKFDLAGMIAPYDSSVPISQLIERYIANADLAWSHRANEGETQAANERPLSEIALSNLEAAQRLLKNYRLSPLEAVICAKTARCYQQLGQPDQALPAAQRADMVFELIDPGCSLADQTWQSYRIKNLGLIADWYVQHHDKDKAKLANEKLDLLKSRFH
jgi:serine/threonine-protein kinase